MGIPGRVGGEKLAVGTQKRQKFSRKIAEGNNKRYSTMIRV
jgi:hypothetical protein